MLASLFSYREFHYGITNAKHNNAHIHEIPQGIFIRTMSLADEREVQNRPVTPWRFLPFAQCQQGKRKEWHGFNKKEFC